MKEYRFEERTVGHLLATLRVEKYKLREEGITGDTWDREKAGYKLKR